MNSLLTALVFLAAALGSERGGPTILTAQQGEPRPRAFWEGIAAGGYAVPEGESAFALIVELSGHLGAPDSVLRDDLGTGIPARWIYGEQRLSQDELRALLRLWSANLQENLTAESGDGGLLRSFSALNLALLAAYDLQHPFFQEEDYSSLLTGSLQYLEQERDLRGWVPELGWCHAVAHTADLLKFLAGSRHLQVDQQTWILVGIAERVRNTEGYVFVHGEDERLAQAVLAVLVREDCDPGAWADFLEVLGASSDWTRSASGFDPVAFAGQQNAKNLARALFVHLSRESPDDPVRKRARQQVLATLGRL